ncbi:MAG: CRTAC1 family protein [Capsulimonadales bacterium]|nr:CRTAC1 family protein [Capsulimonadales bacterium]
MPTPRVSPLSLLALLLPSVLYGCLSPRQNETGPVTASPGPSSPPASSPTAPSPVAFRDVTSAAGLNYRWPRPTKRPLNILQTIGYGCAFLDYDRDDRLDILLIGPRPAIYRGDGKGRFSDVTAALRLDDTQADFRGCAVGDYDNDGFPDLYISGFRTGLLFRNEEGKRFRNVTPTSGMTPQPWGGACAWGDINGDGLLDLYVGNYVRFGPDAPQLCATNGIMTACTPHGYAPEKGVLYLNQGNGRFREATKDWGAHTVSGKTLGVAFADFDNSGRQHLALANDGVPGDLLVNRQGKFENIGDTAGTAYGPAGKPYAGMGLDWGDFDNDGKIDLMVTAYAREDKPLYRNEGDGLFSEVSQTMGLVAPTSPDVAFGVKWLDFDNDGWLDLALANGHTSDNIADINPELTYRQPTRFFRNEKGQRFADLGESIREEARRPIVGRGLATGDYDNDGRIDLLIVDGEGPPLLLHNETTDGGNYLTLRLVGKKRHRDAYGAVVTVRIGNTTRTRICHADGSFFSSSDPRVHFGLGKDTGRTVAVTVRWAGGLTETWPTVAVNTRHTLTEGDGKP